MINCRHIIAALALAGTWSVSAHAPKFSTDVDVVTLLATVRGNDGRIAKNLTREDVCWCRMEESKPITYFSRESDLPAQDRAMVNTRPEPSWRPRA